MNIIKRLMSKTVSEVLEEFHLDLEARGIAPKTLTNYKWRLKRFENEHGDLKMANLKKSHIQRHVVELRRSADLSPFSINAIVQGLKAFCIYAYAEDLIDSELNKTISRKKPRTSKKAGPMSLMTFRKLLDGCNFYRDKLLLLFLLDTAARAGEVVSLTIKNVDLANLRAAVTGKVGNREIYFTQETSGMIQNYLDNHRPPVDHNYLFTSVRRPYAPLKSAHSIWMAFGQIAKRVGIEEEFGPHRIRHLACQWFAREGNLELARLKMGHANLKTTEWYINSDSAYIQQASQEISALNMLKK